MKCRLAAIDIDGTLLDDNYLLSSETKEALRDAKKAGIEIVLCSGRAPHSVFPIMEELEMEGFLITHNGAVTTHSKTKSVINELGFFMDSLHHVVDYCKQMGIHTDFCTAFEMYTDKIDSEELEELYNKYHMTPIIVDDVKNVKDKLVKFTLFGAEDLLTHAHGDLQKMELSLQTIRSGPTFIDILHRQATKGVALSNLAQQLGVSMEETIAIGNYFNDVEMFKVAGKGIAVANAPAEVKKQADFVVSSNNENGVAEALWQIVLEK
jgi:Cof subfamily protein (haloacid dehalogenase superfamily)